MLKITCGTAVMALGFAASVGAAQPFAGVPYRPAQFPPSGAGTTPRLLTDHGLFTSLGERCVFAAESTLEIGRELWITDGTSAGTRLLKDLDPRVSRDLSLSASLAFVDGGVRKAAFIGNDEVGPVVVVTDGSAAGTRVVRLEAPGFAFSFMGAVGGKPLVIAASGTAYELWMVDGDVPVRLAGPWGYFGRLLSFAASTPHWTYFWGPGEAPSQTLWRTDGTAAGTTPVVGFGPVPSGSTARCIALGERVFTLRFASGTTRAVTVDPVDGVASEVAFPPGYAPGFLGVVPLPAGDGVLYGAAGALIRADGADAATSLFLEGVSAAEGLNVGADPLPQTIDSPGGRVTLFLGSTTAAGQELWATDGTPGGTRLLQDITAGAGSTQIATLGRSAGRYFFAKGTQTPTNQVWATDGTPQGTVRWSTELLWNPRWYQIPAPISGVAGDRLLVRPATNVPTDQGLLQSFDSSGTLSLIEPGPGVPRPPATVAGTPAAVGGAVVFPVTQPSGSALLFRSEGSAATTGALVPDLFSNFSSLQAIGGLGWFGATGDASNDAVWRTDGSAPGTFAVGAASRGNTTFGPFVPGLDGVMISSGGIFTAAGGPGSLRRITTDTRDGYLGAAPAGKLLHIQPSSGVLRISVVDPVTGVSTLVAQPSGTDLAPMFSVLANRTYFTLHTGNWGLWRCAGPSNVVSLVPTGAAIHSDLTAVAGGRALFVQSIGGSPVLAAVDSNDAIVQLRTFRRVDEMRSFGDRALLLADDGEHGLEPWITDGTAAGTRMIAETVPGPRGAVGNSYFGSGVVYSGGIRRQLLHPQAERCYFWVATDDLAAHAWVTDGTAAGTRRLGRLPDEVRQLPLTPSDFAETDGAVYFRGWTPDRGVDLYAVRLCEADFTTDGFIDFFDYLAFADAFAAGTPDADFNGDGFVDFFDYGGFVDAFERGC